MNRYLNLIKYTKNWYSYFHAKFLNKNINPIKFKCKNGVALEVPREIAPIFKEIFMEDLYDINFLKKHLPTAPKIIDIGANVGFFDTFILSHYPTSQIVAFEPLPANFAQLKRNQTLNQDKNLHIENKAVSESRGKTSLYYNPTQGLTPIASTMNNFDKKNSEKIDVETVSLSDIMETYSMKEVDLLKLDCEGAEYEILYNTPKPLFDNIHFITMETHSGTKEKENHEDLISFLRALNYQIKTRNGDFIWAWK